MYSHRPCSRLSHQVASCLQDTLRLARHLSPMLALIFPALSLSFPHLYTRPWRLSFRPISQPCLERLASLCLSLGLWSRDLVLHLVLVAGVPSYVVRRRSLSHLCHHMGWQIWHLSPWRAWRLVRVPCWTAMAALGQRPWLGTGGFPWVTVLTFYHCQTQAPCTLPASLSHHLDLFQVQLPPLEHPSLQKITDHGYMISDLIYKMISTLMREVLGITRKFSTKESI